MGKGFDSPAQSVTVYHRHDNIADNHIRCIFGDIRIQILDSRLAVMFNRYGKSIPFKDFFKA